MAITTMNRSTWTRLANSITRDNACLAARRPSLDRLRHSSTSAWIDLAGASTQPDSLIQPFGPSSPSPIVPSDFRYCPDFLNDHEQRVLLRLALWKLDRVDPELRRTGRRRRRSPGQAEEASAAKDLQSMFELPEGRYGFEEVSLGMSSRVRC